MEKTPIQTPKAPNPRGSYSQGIRWGNLLFTAGVGPLDPETGAVVGTTIEAQTTQVMKNLAAILAAENLGFAHVLKSTVHLQNLQRDFKAFDEVYRSFLKPPYPVRTTVGSTLNNILVEVDFVAGLPES